MAKQHIQIPKTDDTFCGLIVDPSGETRYSTDNAISLATAKRRVRAGRIDDEQCGRCKKNAPLS